MGFRFVIELFDSLFIIHLYFMIVAAPMVNEELTIVDTDYENYAIAMNCHNFRFFYTRTMIVFIRSKPMSDTYWIKVFFDIYEDIYKKY